MNMILWHYWLQDANMQYSFATTGSGEHGCRPLNQKTDYKAPALWPCHRALLSENTETHPLDCGLNSV